MKVLYCSERLVGHDKRFLKAIRDQGIESVHLARYPVQPACTGSCADVQLVSKGSFSALVEDMRRIVRLHVVDLIHAGPIQTIAFAAVVANAAPVVSMSWGSDLLRENFYGELSDDVAEMVLSNSNGFIGDCQAVAVRARSLGLAAPQRTFPWGVDRDIFHEHGSAQPYGKGHELVIVCVRRWEPLYDVVSVVEAFAEFLSTGVDAHLVLVGGGSQRVLIEQKLQTLSDRSYTLLDHVPNERIAEIYRAADVYVSASTSDGSSVSLLEAMSCGLPVIVSRIPGNEEWITDGENGLMFDVGDVATLVERLTWFWRMSNVDRSRFGHANAEKIAASADWKRNYPQIGSIYEEALVYGN